MAPCIKTAILGVDLAEERYYASFDERVFLDEVVKLTFTPRGANGSGGIDYVAESDQVWLKTDPEGITRKFCLFRPDRVFWFDPILRGSGLRVSDFEKPTRLSGAWLWTLRPSSEKERVFEYRRRLFDLLEGGVIRGGVFEPGGPTLAWSSEIERL